MLKKGDEPPLQSAGDDLTASRFDITLRPYYAGRLRARCRKFTSKPSKAVEQMLDECDGHGAGHSGKLQRLAIAEHVRVLKRHVSAVRRPGGIADRERLLYALDLIDQAADDISRLNGESATT
jgi:hypothetical protein